MERELERIRAALAGTGKRPLPPPLREAPPATDPVETFRAALTRCGGVFVAVKGESEAEAWVDRYAAGRPVVRDGEGAARAGVEAVGLDTADLLVAETGSVVRSYRTREESRVSLLPASSVFLARRAGLVPDLTEAMDRLEEIHRGGFAYTVLITGPSRTADVEKELVIPAHGPRDLVVVLIA